MSNIRFYWSLL